MLIQFVLIVLYNELKQFSYSFLIQIYKHKSSLDKNSQRTKGQIITNLTNNNKQDNIRKVTETMYFPNVPTPPQLYPQQQSPNIPQSNTFPAQFSLPQTPLFTYPTVIQPYTDRQFLCHTFNFKVPYIEAFLSLSHEQKLKFFLIIEKRRLTGELTEKDSYDKLLHKILLIVNPNYQKPQQQFQEISEEELKKKIIEKEFEQKCDWELRKLGMGEKEEDNSDLWKNYAVQGLGNYTIEGISNNLQQSKATNPQDQQQFIYQQPQPLQHRKSSVMSPRKQPSTKKPQQQQQEDEWQQAQQINPLDQSSKLSIGKYDKVESIWDLELNEEDVKKVEPNIREIFGGKRDGQEDQFGGFQGAKQIGLGMDDYLKPTMTSMNENNHDFSRNNDQLSQDQFPPSSIDQFTPYNQQNTINSPVNNAWLLSVSQTQPHTSLSNPITQNNPNHKPSSQPLFSFDIPQVSNPPSSLPVLQLDFLSLSQVYQPQGTVQANYSNDVGFEFQMMIDGNGPEVHQQSDVKEEQDQFVEAEFVEASYQEADQMDFKQNQQNIPSVQDNPNPFDWNAENSQVKQTLQDSHPNYQPNTSPIINEDSIPTANTNADNQWTFSDPNNSHQPNDENINPLPQTHQPTLSFTKTNLPNVNYTFQSSLLSNDDPFSSIQTVQTPVINPTLTLEPLPTVSQSSGTFQQQASSQSVIRPMNPIANSSQLYANVQQRPQAILQNKSAVSQVKSPTQIRPIRKIAKPPTVKYDEEFVKRSDQDNWVSENKSSVLVSNKESLVQQDQSGKNNRQICITQSQPSLSQVIQPNTIYPPQIPPPTPLKSLTINTQITPSIQPPILAPSLSQSTYTPTQPKQKIISTYNRNFLYSPRFQERKRQTFPAKRLLTEEEQKQRSIKEIEQHSMVDGMLGRGGLGSPVFGKLRKPVSNDRIEYGVEVQDKKDDKVRQVEDMDDEEILDQSQQCKHQNNPKPHHMHKRTATQPQLQPAYNFSKKTPTPLPNPSTTSQPATTPFQQLTTLLTTHSHLLTYQLPQQVTTYLSTQISSNKFCFDKDFYVRLGKILEFLSMEREMSGLREQFGLGDGGMVDGHVFCEEVGFLAEILKKLEMIDQLNKQFTVAMEEDQEEQLAEVVMKSKQLTFQVNEDAQQAKRIATLILKYRVTQSIKCKVQDQDNQQVKYQGIYRILINLLTPTSQPTSPTSPHSSPHSIPLTLLSNLLTMLSPTSSTLLSNIPFLTSFTLLYLLQCHLNQLQYIENISRTVFGYLIKQHTVLMLKIGEIKEMSQKYAEAPQVIFGKLMEEQKMVDFLRGLGEMANCAERILRLVKLIGIRLDLPLENTSNQNPQKYSHQSIQKTITECRQLSIKYYLISPQQPNLKQYQHYILTILTTCLTNQSSPAITYNRIQHLLSQKPICKICMTPKGNQEHGQTGEFITNSAVRSETELGREDTTQVEWCHFVCYNMLKVAFQEANSGSDGFEGV